MFRCCHMSRILVLSFIYIRYCKNPYLPASTMECPNGFEHTFEFDVWDIWIHLGAFALVISCIDFEKRSSQEKQIRNVKTNHFRNILDWLLCPQPPLKKKKQREHCSRLHLCQHSDSPNDSASDFSTCEARPMLLRMLESEIDNGRSCFLID